MAQTQTNCATPFEVAKGGFTATLTVFGPCTRAHTFLAGDIIWSTASTSVLVDITKDSGVTAPGAGTTCLSATIDTSTTANTFAPFVLTGPISLAVGDRLAAKLSGTTGSLAGLAINLQMQPA